MANTYHISAQANIPDATIYISNNDEETEYTSTLFARPFADYIFVKWDDGSTENPRTITVTKDIAMVAIYQRISDPSFNYQYRCYIKDQMNMTDPPKAFMVVDNFDVKRDEMTNANSVIQVIKMADNVEEGDVIVVYDPTGTNLYSGVITKKEGLNIRTSQMQAFYKGTWIYNVHPSSTLEQEIAWLLGQYAQGKIYKSTYTDPQVAQRLSGITIEYTGSTNAKLPTDLDQEGREQLTEYDMEQFIYELYEKYGIIFDFEINFSGTNYVRIKVPNYTKMKVGNNMFPIQDMAPIQTIEETNRLIIFSSEKVYRNTYVATNTQIISQPTSTAGRFNITNTKIVYSDDAERDLIAANLPTSMYNHKLTFTLIVRNFIYQFNDFNLGGGLDIYYNDEYYDSVLTGYQIKKVSNQDITSVNFVCGKVRTKLTQLLTLHKV